LAAGRVVALVTGTNGKTTTSHLLAAALGGLGAVAHNASGSNMADGAVSALAAARDAHWAVLEVDELHVGAVADAVDPAVIVLLNLSRDQLDRGSEVRAVAGALATVLARHPETTVVANADDPMLVWTAAGHERTVWVGAGGSWGGDSVSCPRCGRAVAARRRRWHCRCGLTGPDPHWVLVDGAAHAGHDVVPIALRIPGRFNLGNAVMALAAAALLGVEPHRGVAAMSRLEQVAGRYGEIQHGEHVLRLLLAKNPAGWAETLTLLDSPHPLIVVINAREADGRDTSWLWDVEFEHLRGRRVVAAGERAADLGVRLSYADIDHHTMTRPLAALAQLPPGKIDVVANYTAFHQLYRDLTSHTTASPR
jgi:UDP-N-acetylmuramyl tripeptide synthase